MSFQLSPELDKSNLFLVNRSELDGRLDPGYNLALIKNKISSCFPMHKVRGLCKSLTGGTPSKADQRFWTGHIPWVSPKDMKSFYLSDTIDHITEKAVKESSTNIIPKNSVLLVVRSGILQHTIPVSITTREMSINQDIKALIFNESVLPAYPAYFIDVYQMKLLPLLVKHSTTVQSINTEQFDCLKIPVPPIKIQVEIVAKMDTAYATKKQKEAEAQRLLDSVDDYLLGELEIELPEQEENTIQGRIFTRRLSQVSGGRFDAPIHHKKFSLQTVKYPMARLKDCALINPLTSFYGFTPKTSITFIPMEKVSAQYGEADVSEWRLMGEKSGYTKFRNNDLLWAKITPCMQNGKSAVVSSLHNSIGFGSTEFHVFRAGSDIDINYIHAILRLRSLRNHGVLYFSGSVGHQRVSDEFFKRLSIPKPPPEKQTEIADHITKIRNQAKRLEQQAKAELGQAKKEVEAMILGEVENKR